jgi:PKD repeat protein
MRKSSIIATVLASALTSAPVYAQSAAEPTPPLYITFGIGAHPQEGDPDKRQAFYFSVPADFSKPLFVRLFDPESGGEYDQITTRGPNTTTRFTVFGGKGADTNRFARAERLSHQEEIQGTRLLQKEFRAEPEFDNKWVTLGSVTPDQGDLVDGRYVFRLLVHGLRGHDGNVFDFAVSLSETENVTPQGVRVYSFSPTARTPVDDKFTELRFRIPEDAQSITLGTFDGAGAEVLLTQRFESYPLATSGQNQWEKTTILLSTDDRGADAAITFKGGEEVPNDATYYVTDHNGRVIPFELPVRLLTPVRRPVAVGSAQNLEPCMAVSFDGSRSSDPSGRPLAHRWRFGDGNSAAGAKISYTYEIEGRHWAWLEVTNDAPQIGNGAAQAVDIFVKRPPIARSTSRKLVAANEDVTFDGSASTASKWDVVKHEWRVSDGTVLTGAVATHSFRAPGNYRVTHIVEDASGHRCNTASEQFEIRVNAPPVAVAGPAQLVTASVVQFDGSASHDTDGDKVIRHDWEFGDGVTGTGAKPSHVYSQPGTYEVRLTVTDSAGTVRNTGSATTRVVVNARPIADAGPELIGAPGQALTLDGSRSVDPDGNIAEYSWEFRDGATASGKSVSHAFAAPGIYKVRLRVRDNTGHDEAIDFQEVRVFINHPPFAVAGPPVIAGPGDEIKLSGARSFDRDGKIASYRWDFSDQAEPLQGVEVSRRFEKPGIYTVKLTVTDDSGAINASTSAETRIAVNHAPVAHAGDNIETNQTTIGFDGTKSVDADGDSLTYAWDFGDGQKANGARVTHTYKEGGNYPVVLVVNDGKGLHNSTSQAAVAVRIDRPPVSVAGVNQTACTGDVLVFDGSKSKDPEGGVLRYLWEFGEGSKSEIVNPTMSYRKGGLYPVTLTVRDDSGMAQNAHSDRIAVQIDQGPVATAGPREVLACANSEVNFDGSKSTDVDGVVNSFRWDFGDGNFGGGERAMHIYERPGKYRAFLTIQGEKVGNCSNTSTDEIPVQIIAGPVAAIKAPSAVPITEAVKFDGSESKFSDGKITGWRWDFGDGGSATGAQATHKYAKAGVYRATLTITSDSNAPSCRAVSSRHLVTVNDPPQAAVKSSQLVAVDEEVLFDASASRDPDGAITSYEWDFGDGNKGSGVTARHNYRAPGTYKVKLTVRDNAGLGNSSATIEHAVTVNAPPVPQISGPGVACVNESITWTSDRSNDPDGAIRSFRWALGDGAEAATPSATHRYGKPGRYSMTLFADDGAGLANSRRHVTRLIWVNQPPHAAAGGDRIACPGEAVSFDGSASADADGKLTRFQWDFGDGNTREGAKTEHRFAKPGTYQVRLTVADDSGSSCATNTAALKVLVKAPPVARSGGDREIWVGGANDAILLDASQSSDPDGHALSFAWQLGNGTTAAGERVRQVIPAPGEYKASLTVSDTSGLSCGTATDSFRIIARERK